jgi:hypothetical protein
VLNEVLGITRTTKATFVWAADEVVHAPELAIAGLQVEAIAESLAPGG